MTDIRLFWAQYEAGATDDLRQRLRNVRWPDSETVADASQGPQLAVMRGLHEYWLEEYDLCRVQNRLNAFPQFIFNFDGMDIHFIHVRSKEEGAIPLLLAHGWPGSILEFVDMIDPLTDPAAQGGQRSPAFDVVIPSMPGFGFSGKPSMAGWNIGKIAGAYAALMQQLGYDRWICQGGDLGSAVAEAIGHMRPQGCAGIHVNMSFFQPTPQELEEADEQEREYLKRAQIYMRDQFGYFHIQSTRPQTIGYMLADSPMGLAAFLYEKFSESSGVWGSSTPALTMDQMLDGICFYWLTNSGASAAKLYWELARSMAGDPPPPIVLPAAYSGFSGETILASRGWLEKRFERLVYYNLVEEGGHFAAWEQPERFVNELRFAAPAILSCQF